MTLSQLARRIDDLPGPRGVLLLGNLLQLASHHMPARLEGWAAAHGGVYRLRVGPRSVLVVSDRALADHALSAQPGTFRRVSAFEAVADELGLVGVLTAEGETWRTLRRLSVEALSTRRLPGFYPILRTVAQRLDGRWQRLADCGAAVDVVDEFRRFTTDVTTWLALGRDANTVEGGTDVVEKSLGRIFPVFHRRAVSPVPYWRLFRMPSDRRFDRAFADVRVWLDEVIAQARSRRAGDPERRPADFLEAMLCERDDEGRVFTDRVLVGSALTMLIAGPGHDLVRAGLTVHHLCGRLEARVRLRAEADAVLGAARVPESVEQVERLGYAAAAVNEALRLTPVVPLLYLEANEDTTLGDVAVPRGAPVILLTRPSARQGRFADDETFRPERWLDVAAGAPGVAASGHDPDAHIPFGAGPRACPGRSLALLEARVALATLFRSFDVERSSAPVSERYTSTLAPSGLSVRLRRRD
jgi:cytochrome P450